MPDLSTELAGIRFKNPIIVAAGTPTMNAENMILCIKHGAGGVVAKTVTYAKLHQVQPRPRFHVVHPDQIGLGLYSFYSAELMAEYTPEEWMRELERVNSTARKYRSVLIASIAGRNIEEWVKLASMVEDSGVQMVELNLSCPHVEPGETSMMGKTAGADPTVVEKIVSHVKEAVSIPVAVKLTPHGADPVRIALAAEEAGADVLVATARFQGLILDVDSMKPIEWGGLGGYGGPWMTPISCTWVYKLMKLGVKPSIVGSGGVSDHFDVLRFLMLGAKAVQICTAVIVGGLRILTTILRGVERWMEQKGFKSLDEIVGAAVDNVVEFEYLDRETLYKAVVDSGRCTGCGRCLRSCFYHAIKVKGSVVYVDRDLCAGCGLCRSLCPTGAISLRRIE